MTFVHPWLLAGMVAALIPLLVHLFDRRRPRPVPFAALAFVLRSQRRTASRLKLKRLLLYALRTLILLALPLALARPELRHRGVAAARVSGPAATAVVLDASFAMRYADGATLFARGQDEARAALRGLLPEEPATLLVCGAGPTAPPAPGFERARLLAALDDATPSYETADMSRCLELATHALEESPMAAKRLIVVSAFTSGSFHLEAPPPTVPAPDGKGRVRPEVLLRDVAGGKKLPNHALVEVKAEPAPQTGPRAFQVTLTERNFSDTPMKDVPANVVLDEQVMAKGFLDVPAQGTVQKTLTYRFDQGGAFVGSVRVAADALAEDDRRDFVVQVPRELRTLVINGEPSSVRYRDEAFFVDAALSAPGSPVHETLRDAEAGWKERFDAYDVIELLNVTAPSVEDGKRLEDFVQKGGGLLISAGDHVEPDAYNARLAALLPRPLRVVKTAVQPTDPDVDSRAARLKELNTEHPLFAPFTGKAREGLMSARFYRYLLVESGASDSKNRSEILATYEDGAPALASSRVGSGRVLLFTSTLDRDWSDFAIRTSFLPLMQRAAAYLAGALEEREPLRARVGQTLTLTPLANQRLARVTDPDGAAVMVRTAADGSLQVGPLLRPGVHQVIDTAGKPVAPLAFGVTLDPGASDLTRLKPEELAAYFGEESVKGRGGVADARGAPLWTWLLVIAALAFFFEGALLRKT